jgi:hypothetical protein
VKSAVLTAIDSRAGVAPPTTTVAAGPTVVDVVGAGLDAIGGAGAVLEGELGGGLDPTLGNELSGGDGTGVVIGEFDGSACWLPLPVHAVTTSNMIATTDARTAAAAVSRRCLRTGA